MPESEARKRWMKENTTFIGLKLNNKTDADILSALQSSGEPIQTTVKKWIRAALAARASAGPEQPEDQ